jgi:hypothetical protein
VHTPYLVFFIIIIIISLPHFFSIDQTQFEEKKAFPTLSHGYLAWSIELKSSSFFDGQNLPQIERVGLERSTAALQLLFSKEGILDSQSQDATDVALDVQRRCMVLKNCIQGARQMLREKSCCAG